MEGEREAFVSSIDSFFVFFFSHFLSKKNNNQKQPYGQLLDNLLGLGESLQLAGAPPDAVVGAAEKLLQVQRGTLRRSTALLREATDYDPSRFVDGGNGENEGPATAAAAAGGGGAGSATDFAAKLARRRRSSSRRSGESGESGGESSGGESENGDDDDSDSAAAEALAVELDPRARDALDELRQQEDRLDELRGFAPGERRRRARGGGAGDDDDEVMEVRGDGGGGGGGGRPGPLAMVVAGDGGAAAAGGGGGGGHHHQNNANALLGGARNARCPLTSRPLAEIAEPVEDERGFGDERAAVERYILTETAKRLGGGRGTRAMAMPPPGSAASAYPADVVQRATSTGVVAPVAGTGHNVSLGALRPARRLLRELAARRARAGGVDEMEGGGAGAGADADIEISE